MLADAIRVGLWLPASRIQWLVDLVSLELRGLRSLQPCIG